MIHVLIQHSFCKYFLLIMLLQLSQFFALCPPPPGSLLPSSNLPLLSSCPCVMHVIFFFAYPLSILFLTSPCLFCSYPTMLLNPCTFSLLSPFPLPADNPPNDLHVYDSLPVVVVCLVSFCFCCLDSVVDSCLLPF